MSDPRAGVIGEDAGSPRLSAVVVTIDDFETVRRLVEYLAAQTVRESIEIVLVAPDQKRLGSDRELLAGFHSFQELEFGLMPSVQEPRFAGAAAARAPIVVFTEDHCFPEPGWAAALIAGFDDGEWTGVAPSVGLANPATFRAWANYLIQYGPWVQPTTGGERRDLPGHNSSFRRHVFAAYPRFDEAMVFDTVFHAELYHRGARFRLEPQARTYHVFMTKLVPFLAENFYIGQQFAGTRSRRWSPARRAAWVAGAPLIPLVRLARIFGVMRRQCWTWPLAIGAAPSLLLGLGASAAGEALGYAVGVGGSAAQTLRHDFRRWRAVEPVDRALWSEERREFAYDPPRPSLPSPLELARGVRRDLRSLGYYLGAALFGGAGDPDQTLAPPVASPRSSEQAPSIAIAHASERGPAPLDATTPDAASIEVSVVVASFNARSTIARCLEALRAQETTASYEVLLVDSSTDGTADAAVAFARDARDWPGLRIVRSPERRFAGDARNLGIAAARGRVVALTDADCVAAPDWVERVTRAHRSGRHAVVGGVVGVANPERFIGWGYYLAEFHRWRPGTAAGAIDEVPGCCLSFTRDAFARWGPFLERTYSSDTAFHWRMARDGVRPWLDPSIRVDHINPLALGPTLRHGVLHGRQFAAVRVAERRLARPRILLHVLASPLLPALLLARAVAGMRRNRAYAGRFAVASPAVAANLCAWSLGELLGYLAALAPDAPRRHPGAGVAGTAAPPGAPG